MSKRTCSIDGCDKPVNGRGWCKMHLTRFYRHGDPMAIQAYPDGCSIEGCERKFYARGWCRLHYNRWLSNGDPLVAAEQYSDPDESFAARIRRDPATGCLVWTGRKNRGGYGQMYVGNDSVPVHRYAWERVNGPVPDGMCLDHVCYNRACAEVSHLRIATLAQNSWNRSGPAANSSTGVRNVHVKNGRYLVKVWKNGEAHYGGTFDTVAEAAPVAAALREELFGAFAGRGGAA